MGQLKRRDILKAGVVGAAALGFPAIIRAQAKEVVMLGLWDQTGAFADVGPLNDRGMRMALEERGMKILGRPIKYVTRDGATQAGTSTRRAEEAIDGEGARFMIGPWSSGVALAVSEVAKRKKVLHFFSGGTEDISGVALPPLLVPVGGEPLHRGEDRGRQLHEGQPEGEALAPAGRRLRLRLVGGEVHQGSRQDPRPRVRRRRPPSAGRARVLELRAEGGGQPARRRW